MENQEQITIEKYFLILKTVLFLIQKPILKSVSKNFKKSLVFKFERSKGNKTITFRLLK